MTAQAKRYTLIALCGLPVTVLAFQSFFFQELFFAFLLFAMVFLVLLVAACLLVGVWVLYERAVVYLATWTVKQGSRAGHRTLPLVQAVVLWLAPTVTETAGAVSEAHQTLLDPFEGKFKDKFKEWMRSFRLDASRLRDDAERVLKHLRLLLKHS